jgi:hypothetical protein
MATFDQAKPLSRFTSLVLFLAGSAGVAWLWFHLMASYLSIETSLQRRGTQQVFFHTGQGFAEAQSHRQFIDEAFRLERYRISTPPHGLEQIRLDPADTDGWVRMQRFDYKPTGRWLPFPLLKPELPSHGLQGIDALPGDSGWLINPTYGNTDPYVLIADLPAPVTGVTLVLKGLAATVIAVISLILIALLHHVPAKGSRFILRVLQNHLQTPELAAVTRILRIAGSLALIALSVIALRSAWPERPSPSLLLSCTWSGYPVESIRLDYDLGDGFQPHQSRLAWNRDGAREMDLQFFIPAPSIVRLRLVFPAGNEAVTLSSLQLHRNGDMNPVPIDLTGWIHPGVTSVHSLSEQSITFETAGPGPTILQSPLLSKS